MNILVTGGAGFIGSHLVDTLQKEGHQVTVFDNLSTGHTKNLPQNTALIEGGICDTALVAKTFKEGSFDAVFHLAAQINVRASVENPLQDAETNILGSLNLLDNAQKNGVKKFIFSSTGGVMYGDTDRRPTPEEEPAAPICPYGISKLALEKYLNFYSDQGMQTIALRYGNVYGPRQNPHGEAGVVAIFLQKMLAGVTPIINGDGSQTRDYIFVSDVIKANLLALSASKSGTYNIGTGTETSVNTIFQILNRDFGNAFKETYGPSKPGEQMSSCLDISQARRELGWETETPFSEGIKQTYEWFKANS